MSDPVIFIKNLSKVYKLYDLPKNRIKEIFNPFRKVYHREHFALRDISFSVQRGETLGIIGRNGAGKSTLLKILTGVLTPTSGDFFIRGRIASLLELGAGVNPELTGRENIFFYGLLNGVEREQMNQQVDKIIHFADIGEYIDHPMKTYSSGMFVRLAFGIVIHTDPDILIIDEALSVGDAKFQRKCFNKLNELKEKKTTILLVSHDLDSLKKQCDRALLIENGEILSQGLPKDVIISYLDVLYPKVEDDPSRLNVDSGQYFSIGNLIVSPENKIEIGTFGVGGAQINSMTIGPCSAPNIFNGGQKVEVVLDFEWDPKAVEKIVENDHVDSNISVGFALSDKAMNYIFGCNTFDASLDIDPSQACRKKVSLNFTLPVLKADDYFVTLAIAVGRQNNHIQMKWYDGVGHLKVETSRSTYGVLALDYKFEVT